MTFVKINALNTTIDLEEYTNLHLYFPHYCPILVKFGIRYLNIMLLSIHDFQQNWCREGHTLFTIAYARKFTCIPISFSVSPPATPPPFLTPGQGVATFLINIMAVMVITSMGRLPILDIPKNIMLFSFLPPPLRNNNSRKTMGQNQEF